MGGFRFGLSWVWVIVGWARSLAWASGRRSTMLRGGFRFSLSWVWALGAEQSRNYQNTSSNPYTYNPPVAYRIARFLAIFPGICPNFLLISRLYSKKIEYFPKKLANFGKKCAFLRFLLDNKYRYMLNYIEQYEGHCNAPRTKIQGSTRLGI